MRRQPVVVTGGIASGKSTVLSVWREAGLTVANADDIARQVFDSSEVQAEIGKQLGTSDRDEVRKLVMADPVSRKQLNRITHPLIYRHLKSADVDALEIPLLMEGSLWSLARAVVVVWCPVDLARERLASRKLASAEIDGVLAAQVSPNARLPFADAVIRTNQPIEGVKADAERLVHRFFS